MIESKENSCAFYASDYHLEMIMLPYINENFKNNKTVYVFTQNNLTNTVNTLMEKVNNNLKQLKDYKGIEVIDCYNLNDINGEVRNISTKYGSVLKTLGK